MCGIIAVVRGRSRRLLPASAEILDRLGAVPNLLELGVLEAGLLDVDGLPDRDGEQGGNGREGSDVEARLARAAEILRETDRLLQGSPGVRALLADRALVAGAENLIDGIGTQVAEIEVALDDAGSRPPANLERLNALLIDVKDAVWAIARDRLRTARAVGDLAGADAGTAAIDVYLSIQQALSALDRLEVRGRDSAGLHVLVQGHGLDLGSPAIANVLADRSADPLFGAMAVRAPNGQLSFVYKAAAEIGELGDNTASLRRQITDDALLRQALAADGATAVVLGHTRWASVGIISQFNAHPLNSDEVDRTDGAYVTAVLNGDVDNFADLKATRALRIAHEITTDAKVIPTLVSRRLDSSGSLLDAFRQTVNELEGSVAIAASSALAPDALALALRGSGQALYVGLAEDAFIVASEPYGVVEDAERYLRMDGETQADPTNPATRGQIVVLHAAEAGTVDGLERFAYDGSALDVTDDDIATAAITTRDIDRGSAPHFLLKEMTEAPGSFRKTLRGKLVEQDGQLAVVLPDEALTAEVRERLRGGTIRRVLVIGQGTAAVAGQSLAVALQPAVDAGRLAVEAKLATELSGFDLREDMSDTLVVAVSQSGTTTDTNRTVDLVRSRGGKVIAIVNRRGSDLTDKADGVLYTSDGRDVEMSVASTKAFYSQIAACFLLGFAIADEVGVPESDDRREFLVALRDLPSALEGTIALRPQLAEAAQRFAPSRRYWAIVGNGVNRIAAQEVRIKLSELCYKSIACDATEDKKHIDLSSEPLILVCAAGLSGSTADDVAKEVAIYRAHKAAPIVFATEGEERFSAALQAVLLPVTHPSLAFVLSAMAGHLFGYEAALAIDALARPLREARGAIEVEVSDASDRRSDERLLERLDAPLDGPVTRFFEGLRNNDYNGHLEASTAVRVASLLRFARRLVPLEAYQLEHGRQGTPSVVVEDLTNALTRAIEELTRPIDAIKHQAKTVTVGISRSDETLLQVGLVKEVLSTGVARDRLSYESLRTLTSLDPLIADVLGYTRYGIDGTIGAVDGHDQATVSIVDRGGLGRELRSRVDENPVLRGTKHRVAAERVVTLAKGRSDGRTVLIVPEVKDKRATGLTLLHVTFREDLSLEAVRTVLQGYRQRYTALQDVVTETEPTFRDDILRDVPIVELMTAPLYDLAEHWRS
jgi:glucosamine--fructose-6-phosphate aminotransferase (isomerizing)